MRPVTATVEIVCTASTVQSLGGLYWGAYGKGSILSGTATAGSVVKATALSPITGTTPSSSQFRFDGTPASPASTVTLSAAPVAGVRLTVQMVLPGGIAA